MTRLQCYLTETCCCEGLCLTERKCCFLSVLLGSFLRWSCLSISSASNNLSCSALLCAKGIHQWHLSSHGTSPVQEAQALQLGCLKPRTSVQQHVAGSCLQLQFIFIQSQMVTAILLDKAKCECSTAFYYPRIQSMYLGRRISC